MKHIALSAATAKTFGFLFLFCVVLPVVSVLLVTTFARMPRANVLWPVIGVGLVTFAVLAAVMLRQSAHESSDGRSVRIKSSFYAVELRWSDISGEPRVLCLQQEPDKRPQVRTNGMAVPGYSSGWYRTREQKRVFAHIVSDQVLYVPTRSGYDLIVSVQNPQAAADYIRSRVRHESTLTQEQGDVGGPQKTGQTSPLGHNAASGIRG